MLEIIEVHTKKTKRLFNQLVRDLYKQDAEFISHLDQDIEAIFNPEKNLNFKDGNAMRWLAYKNGKPAGKIAAFYNPRQSGIGFFDSVDEQEVANALFDVACKWLKEQGQNRVEAPVNFGERDKYWGLLVEGFKNPSYQEPYNFPYYKTLFERYGFVKKFEQTTSEAHPDAINRERYEKFKVRSESQSGLVAKHFNSKDVDKYVKAFTTIYNEAWNQHEFYVPLKEERVAKLFKSMKPILREDIMWFMFDGDRPVAFYISIIDVNQIFKYLGGKMNWWGKMKFLWYRSRVKVDRIRGIIFGVVPDYQNKGAYSSMVVKMHDVILKDPYLKSTELSWIGDFNPKMHALFRSMNAVRTKLHYTYEKDL
jgi:hypothetical protein